VDIQSGSDSYWIRQTAKGYLEVFYPSRGPATDSLAFKIMVLASLVRGIQKSRLAPNIDPSGDVGVFFGGSGEQKNDMTGTIQTLFAKYDGKEGVDKIFVEVPAAIGKGANLNIDVNNLTNGPLDFIRNALKKHIAPECQPFPVDLFGYSRGGALANVLAIRLSRIREKIVSSALKA
jgi:hypothetical protein